MDHAKFSPSKMERIMLCPGSATMEEALREQGKMPPPSTYAEHGTKLHAFTHDSIIHDTVGNLEALEPEDRSAVLDCLDYRKMILSGIGHDNVSQRYESKVSLSHWGLPEVWGTVDVLIKDNIAQHLHVVDWKFGSGVWVSAWENAQMMTYAAGALLIPTQTKKVTLHVAQPFLENWSTYEMPYSELYEWVHSKLAVSIGRAKEYDPEFIPGPDQCRWCAGKNHCQVRFNWARENAGRVFRYADMTDSIPQEEMIELIEIGSEIESAIKGYKAFVSEEIQRGRPYPGLKLVNGKSFRKWVKDETAIIQYVEENTDLSDMDLFETKLMSPAKIEKLDRKLKKDEGFQALYEQPPGKPTLVKESDPRPAIEAQKRAVDIFKDYAVPKENENNL